MAWFRSYYHCGDCGTDWEDEWSCCCDDECPECGSGDWSPVTSDDLTEVTVNYATGYAVIRSAADADYKPRYRTLATFKDAAAAERFRKTGELI